MKKANDNPKYKRGRMTPGARPVSEGTRIDIAKVIAEFQASDNQGMTFYYFCLVDRVGSVFQRWSLSTAAEFKFPPDLTNHERAIVHSECKKYGFTSKSFGKGDNRAVCIFKRRRQGSQKAFYEFAPELATFTRIESYFQRFPPKKNEVKTLVEESQTTADGRNALSRSYSDKKENEHSAKKPRKHPVESVSKMPSAEIQKKHSVWQESMKSNKGSQMMAVRKTLPIAEHRDEILAKVRNHQVVLIAGETGCGKTTQVPQYILEDCWSRGQSCKIMCTQPRRLSATSVADRIAQERMEPLGSSVGYTIRLDKKGDSRTPIMFCTNGIMLRMLTSDDTSILQGITHIVVDEIHERDRFADFMLIIIRDILPRYPDIRLVLMSATLHEELFSDYFGGCPVIRVPGFTYPVKDFYLEDILRVTGYEHAALQELQRELGDSIHQLSNRTKRKLSDAIENAFRNGGDEDFRVLLELTGSADTETTVDDQEARVNFRHPDTGATPLFCACFRGRGDVASVLLSNGADPSIQAENGMTPADCAEQFGFQELGGLVRQHSENAASNTNVADAALALSHYQSNTDTDEVDLGLIEEILLYICGEKIHNVGKNDCKRINLAVSGVEKEADAILVFLPGWDEIIRLRDILEASNIFGSASKYLVLPLHSMISPAEQKKVFMRPPKHVRKIILSTNIAETAITIDDIAIIIDSGRQKEKSFDPYTGVSTLQSGWISKASVRQRKGRAGRCREGIAFHLYSAQRFDSMEDYQAPELMRTPLDEMGLQVKLLDTSVRIADFLSKAVEPPIKKAIESAVTLLENIGAIEEGTENLTLLGKHLASLPIPPMLGKMLMYGSLFQCLDPILTIACCLAYRDPWILPASVDGRRRAAKIKRDMSIKGSGFSDHLATVVAFNEWKHKSRMGDAWRFCNQNFLNNATMTMIDGMRHQLVAELMNRGVIQSLEGASSKASNPDIVRSVLAAGLYPNIGRVAGNPRRDQHSKPAIINSHGERVRIHPSSVNSALRNDVDNQGDVGRASILVYDELTRGDNLIHVKSSTEVNPHAIILVASHLSLQFATMDEDQELSTSVDRMDINDQDVLQNLRFDSFWETLSSLMNAQMILSVDGWIHYKMPAQSAIFFSILRQRLVSAFAQKASHPKSKVPPYLEHCVTLITNMFQKDGRTYGGNNGFLHLSYVQGPRQKPDQSHTLKRSKKPSHPHRVGHSNNNTQG